MGPYEIVNCVGSGGMGVVYKAWDTRLNRFIALKTISDESLGDTGARHRFLREAQAASQLNHPNIVTIHETLETGDACCLIMEYVEGRTLERMIAPQLLPLPDILHYASQIADALSAAHRAGIVHRDLKPANIMITGDRRVKLLDFGLARFTLPAHSSDTPTQTIHGVVLGTAPYMSPEQAEGLPLDTRSDIFSFGCLLYEMFSGRRAFRRESWVATLAAILDSEPTPLHELRPGIPRALEEHIQRCLRKDPADRFQSVAEIKQSLAAITLHASVRKERPSIAVLPFANLSADKENEYFSDGLAEEILNSLTKTQGLRVIARASAFSFRGQQHDIRSVGQRLRVQNILEGSVRRSGNRIRVTADLIRVEDESQLWSERYDRELTDVFAIQDDIAREIAAALKLRLTSRDTRPTNIEAYQSYLKGIYWYQRYTAQSLVLAKESFEHALFLDPGYAPAHAGLAVFYYSLGALSIQRMSDVGPLARASAEKALELDHDLSEAHSVLGLLAGAVEYQWDAAALHFKAAMALEPVPPLVRMRYALYYLLPLKRYDDALEQYSRALETDPLSMMILFGIAFALYCQERYLEAVEEASRAVDLYPDYWLVHFAMGMAQCRMGTLRDAMASLEKTLQLAPSFALATGYLAALCGLSGDPERGERLMQELVERRRTSYVSSSAFAIYYAAMGQADIMFQHLYAALEEREPFLTRVGSEPYFWPYYCDPRYKALLQKMNLA